METLTTGGVDRGPSPRSGVALASVVLATALLVILAHSLFILTRAEWEIARMETERLAASAEGRSAVLVFASALDSLPPSGASLPTGMGGRRLSPETFWVETRGPGRWGGQRWGSLLYALRPEVRVQARPAEILLARPPFLHPGARLAPPEAGGCGPLPARAGTPAVRALGPDFPDLDDAVLGPWSLESLILVLPAVPVEEPGWSPTTVGGACTSPWGSPAGAAPCRMRWGSGGRDGDLRLDGSGQGVLAVRGDLVLEPDAHLAGWIVVGGGVRVSRGAVLEGVVSAGGRLVVEGGGEVRPSRCVAFRALAANPQLREVRVVGPPAWPLD